MSFNNRGFKHAVRRISVYTSGMEHQEIVATPVQPVCDVCSLGRVSYAAAWQLQRQLAAQRSAGQIADTLLLVEHPHTYTLGRSALPEHLLCSPAALAAQGIEVFDADRGGDVTYHGPGQLVCYPILKLSRYGGDLVGYLRLLEETLIVSLATFGVSAGRIPGLTGVWIGADKVAAIGVKLTAGGVTMHGFALNVCVDLRFFEQIVPCGIRGRGVTSLDRIVARPPTLGDVERSVVQAFDTVFGAARRRLIESRS
jgi:lipoyl(octanoyl) transferase